MCQVGHGKWWHWDRGLKISSQVRDVVWVNEDRNEGGVEESGRGAAAALAGGSALRCSRRTWNSEVIQENRHALLDALDVISGGLQLRLEFLLLISQSKNQVDLIALTF